MSEFELSGIPGDRKRDVTKSRSTRSGHKGAPQAPMNSLNTSSLPVDCFTSYIFSTILICFPNPLSVCFPFQTFPLARTKAEEGLSALLGFSTLVAASPSFQHLTSDVLKNAFAVEIGLVVPLHGLILRTSSVYRRRQIRAQSQAETNAVEARGDLVSSFPSSTITSTLLV